MKAARDNDFDGVPPAVQLENVGVRYGMGPEILRDLTFSIEPRSFQFLTGPSGAGKTTLLRLILLSVKPTRGLVSLSARVFRGSRRTGSPVCAVAWALCSRISGCSITSPLMRTWPSRCAFRASTRPAIAARSSSFCWVGLGDRMHVLPPVLSGGEKQRAAIARALIVRPELLLADEPTGNVDPSLARRLLRLFIELNRLGTSVVIATHDLALMDQLDVRRLVLGDGRLHIDE